MSNSQSEPSTSVRLSDEDMAYLHSVLRDAGRGQPLTTQQLIDAIRARVAH